MSFFLFVLEIFLVVVGVALVPAQSELRVSRAQVIGNKRKQRNSLRPSSAGHFQPEGR